MIDSGQSNFQVSCQLTERPMGCLRLLSLFKRAAVNDLLAWDTLIERDENDRRRRLRPTSIKPDLTAAGRLSVCAWLFVMTIAGCGESGPKVFHVSGAVTFNGQPIPAGTVMFTPDQSKGGSGPAGLAVIKNGKYDTSSTDGTGVVGGPHIVQIIGLDGKPVEMSPEGVPLFPDYTTTLDLPKEKTTHDFSITGKVKQRP